MSSFTLKLQKKYEMLFDLELSPDSLEGAGFEENSTIASKLLQDYSLTVALLGRINYSSQFKQNNLCFDRKFGGYQ